MLAVHDRLTECEATAVPVPVRLVEEGEFVALLVKVAVAEAEPAAVGVNVTVKFTLLPDAIVTGNVRPVTVNSEPFVPPILTPVTCTLPPEAVSVPVLVMFEPTVALPTAIGFGLTASVGCAAATPVPVRLVEEGLFEALLVKVAVAEAEPAAVGVNVTVKFTLLPDAIVTGRVNPVTVNSEPLVPPTLTPVTCTLPPEAVSVPVLVMFEPTVALPTAIGFGLTASVGCAAATPVPVRLVEEGLFEALLVKVAVAEAEPAAVGVNLTVKFTLLPEAIVTGNERPVIVNSEPFVPPILTPVTCTLPPEAVSVPVLVMFEPTVALPTAIGFGLTASVACGAVVADPDNATFKVEFEASDPTIRLPVMLPAACGVNFTLKVAVWPGANVDGNVIPETLNPLPVGVSESIVPLIPPVFLMVSLWVELCPIVTFENVRLAGVAVNTAGVIPPPESAISTVALAPLTVNESCPLLAPIAVGEYFTLKLVLCPPASVKGSVRPLSLNPVPLTAAAVMVMLAVPVFFKVPFCVSDLSTCTPPKLKLLGLGARSVAGVPVPESVTLAEPLALARVSVPLALPVLMGANTTLNCALCPAASVKGVVRLLVE